MKRTTYQQIVLTSVANKKLDFAGIERELNQRISDNDLKLIGSKILDQEGETAADFFLLGEYLQDINISKDDSINNSVKKVGMVISSLYEKLRLFFSDRGYDFCLQNYNPVTRKKRALFSDMDATIISNETLDDVAVKAGIGEEVSKITKMGIEGKIDFKRSIMSRLALLKGIDLAPIIDEVSNAIQINPGAETLSNTLNHYGVDLFLITGGFDPIASHVQEKLKFKYLACNKFKIEDGLCTGEYEGELVNGERKLSVMENHLISRGMLAEQALAIGDGSNDIPMLEHAGLGVAYRATEKVRSAIPHQINFTPLTTLLYYQGYSRKDFIHE